MWLGEIISCTSPMRTIMKTYFEQRMRGDESGLVASSGGLCRDGRRLPLHPLRGVDRAGGPMRLGARAGLPGARPPDLPPR